MASSKYEEKWDRRYLELVAYKNEHGNCLVPVEYPDNPKLGYWVGNQRKFCREGRMSRERISRLEDLGFAWDKRNAEWEMMYKELARYKRDHGDCIVPQRYQENPGLASWVTNQRKAYHQGRLGRDRAQRLEDLGFAWDGRRARWERRFKDLIRYSAEHGHCYVKVKDPEKPELANWVRVQHKHHREGKLDREKTEKLESIGFEWIDLERDSWSESWEKKFNRAQKLWAHDKDMPLAQIAREVDVSVSTVRRWRKRYSGN